MTDFISSPLAEFETRSNAEQGILLLRAAYLTESKALLAWRQWHSEYHLDSLLPGGYALAPRLYRNLSQLGVDDPEIARFKGVYRKSWYMRQFARKWLTQIVAQLGARGNPVVLLGGVGNVEEWAAGSVLFPNNTISIYSPLERGCRVSSKSRLFAQVPARLCERQMETTLEFTDGSGLIVRIHAALPSDHFSTGEHSESILHTQTIETQLDGLPCAILSFPRQLLWTAQDVTRWSSGFPVSQLATAMDLLPNLQTQHMWQSVVQQACSAGCVLPLIDVLGFLQQNLNVTIPANIWNTLNKLDLSRREQADYINWQRPPYEQDFAFRWRRHYARFARRREVEAGPRRLSWAGQYVLQCGQDGLRHAISWMDPPLAPKVWSRLFGRDA